MSLILTEEGGEGKEIFLKQLKQISDEIEGEIAAELDAVLERIRDAAIDLCPKETGALASSITIDNSGVVSAGDFYGNSISCGDPNIVNPKTGVPTSQYASLVHEGHGTYEGVPFLDEAMLMYFEELEACVDRALKEITAGMENE